MNSPDLSDNKKTRAYRKIAPLGVLSGFGIAVVSMLLLYSQAFGRVNGGSGPANASDPAAAAPATNVAMQNLQFTPATVQVRKGDRVEWTNEDLVPHNVTSPLFHSGPLMAGQTWSHTFTNAGNYPYQCTFHPRMKGRVIVK
ncbi:MAG: cupredoxin domain-containing protein [Limisphaerales bacterium]